MGNLQPYKKQLPLADPEVKYTVFCAKCQRPVSSVNSAFELTKLRHLHVVARCHGEEQRVEVSIDDVLNAEIKPILAFQEGAEGVQ